MNIEEYKAAIKRQQSLIRRLITRRRKRSKVIDSIVQQRYAHLVGKFFKNGKTLCRVTSISGESNYIMSDKVDVYLNYKYLDQERVSTMTEQDKLIGIRVHSGKIYEQNYNFEIIEKWMISESEAREYFNKITDELNKNFG